MKESAALIGDTYRIIGQAGLGGGGIVYLGENIRLKKKVALKAARRSQKGKPEILRREADLLKKLHHAYIPQVYDFIQDSTASYTVMEYFDGATLAELLKRGQRFSQAQVMQWARRLLDVLVYLHNIPPYGIVHGDIKPSNIILTPRNEIRLIDFNTARVLQKGGVIAAGRSFGYASPEHYGPCYFAGEATPGAAVHLTTDLSDNTEADDAETLLDTSRENGADNSRVTWQRQHHLLDARSDVYSLGATLYNLLTGRRPAWKAAEVRPISGSEFSPATVAIITKAMHPDREQRWQTAREMLSAIEQTYSFAAPVAAKQDLGFRM